MAAKLCVSVVLTQFLFHASCPVQLLTPFAFKIALVLDVYYLVT